MLGTDKVKTHCIQMQKREKGGPQGHLLPESALGAQTLT